MNISCEEKSDTRGYVLTHEELDAKVASLKSVGGLYLIIAAWVEEFERPKCEGNNG